MFRRKLLASAIHLGVSVIVAILVAAFVFLVWYPEPYTTLSKGTRLFLLIVAVDVTLGPCLTLVVFNPAKSRRELTLDLSLIGIIQLAALAYGLHTVHSARPVALVYEVNRFRIVHATDIDDNQLYQAPEAFRKLPNFERLTLGVRPFRNADESRDATLAALNGVEIAFRPEFWTDYNEQKEQVRRSAVTLQKLIELLPGEASRLRKDAAQTGLTEEQLLATPVIGRDHASGTIFLNASDLQIAGYSLVDPYPPSPENQQSR